MGNLSTYILSLREVNLTQVPALTDTRTNFSPHTRSYWNPTCADTP